MNTEKYTQKWLNDELTPEEFEVFKQTEAYKDYKKIVETAAYFKAPEFDTTTNYTKLKTRLTAETPTQTTWLQTALKIAAVFLIGIATYFSFFYNPQTQFQTEVTSIENIQLPDESEVTLNAGSSLNYQKNNWEDNRVVHLEGEAFFQVAKGKRFDVKTQAGTISVLGTKFNVKQREGYFEVHCYEGLVAVKTPQESVKLPAGKSFRIIKNQVYKDTSTEPQPSWIKGTSNFKSVPFNQVIAELERQYNIQVSLKNLTFDTDELFTGTFVHHDLETALAAVTVPFNLAYSINDRTVTLKESE